MVELDFTVLYVLPALLLATASKVTSLKAPETGNNIVQHLDTVHGHLKGLSRSIRSAHADLTAQQLDECQIMGPMSDPICSLLDIDRGMTSQEAVEALVHNKLAPGKRGGQDTESVAKRKVLLQDLSRKQKFLEDLKALIDGVQSSLQVERKRSCNLNLGFHCQTEQYSAIADMYNWLQSSMSPGRRKRAAAAGARGSLGNVRRLVQSPKVE